MSKNVWLYFGTTESNSRKITKKAMLNFDMEPVLIAYIPKHCPIRLCGPKMFAGYILSAAPRRRAHTCVSVSARDINEHLSYFKIGFKLT